ncbi:MAG: Crp/Fnr family transcriptional regulator [Ferruginibacter sp.]|nr:Crp/Fnr family transcriptional regulator [Ferruginibacter sp.]
MESIKALEKLINCYGQELVNKILEVSTINEFPKNTQLVREGQFVKFVPIVLKGFVKVFIEDNEKQLLLYYIQPNESCIMSFTASLNGEASKIFAVTQEETSIILIPSEKLSSWVLEYPKINHLFYQQFNLRYTEFIKTIHHLLFDNLEKRLLDYLKEKSTLIRNKFIKISHKEIANDLGTAREVISRLLKKLEHQNIVKQHNDSIEIY